MVRSHRQPVSVTIDTNNALRHIGQTAQQSISSATQQNQPIEPTPRGVLIPQAAEQTLLLE